MDEKKDKTSEDTPTVVKFKIEPDAPVYCSCDDYIPLDEFVHHPENPNMHPRDQIVLLAEILAEGWRQAVVVSNRSGYVTKGHGRLIAAAHGGFRGAPVDYQDYASEEAEKADMLADNAIAALSHRDPAKVKPLVVQLQQKGTNINLTGLRPLDLKKLFKEEKKPAEALYKITADMNECYDYVLVFVRNEIDEAFLHSLLGIEREQSHKKSGLGLGRAIEFEKFMRMLIEHREMIDKVK